MIKSQCYIQLCIFNFIVHICNRKKQVIFLVFENNSICYHQVGNLMINVMYPSSRGDIFFPERIWSRLLRFRHLSMYYLEKYIYTIPFCLIFHLVIQCFIRYSFSASHVPDTVAGPSDAVVSDAAVFKQFTFHPLCPLTSWRCHSVWIHECYLSLQNLVLLICKTEMAITYSQGWYADIIKHLTK